MASFLQSRQPEQAINYDELPHVVIIGAGFGGLQAALQLGKAPVKLTIIDRNNHHLFQPLLYQVATATLSPGEITAPIRHILRKNKNTDVIMSEVTNIDTEQQRVWMHNRSLSYDYLIVATGSHENYFGHDEWRAFSHSLKTIEDARIIRNLIFQAFEQAEIEQDPARVQELLTLVIIGAGPTGVELAGDIADITHRAIRKEFRHIDPSTTRIILVEAMDRILLAFPERQAKTALKKLQSMGVEVKLNAPVTAIDAESVTAGDTIINTHIVLWTAGVQAAKPSSWLNAPTDRARHAEVEKDLSLRAHPNVFVIGDATAPPQQNGKALPAVAPVAMQEGRYVARRIIQQVTNDTKQKVPAAFHYHNKGNLATIGRGYGLFQLGNIQISGLIGWILWLTVHIFYLISFENRLLVMVQWIWAYLSYRRRMRIITPTVQQNEDVRQRQKISLQ